MRVHINGTISTKQTKERAEKDPAYLVYLYYL